MAVFGIALGRDRLSSANATGMIPKPLHFIVLKTAKPHAFEQIGISNEHQ